MMSYESNVVAINPALSFGLNFDSRDLQANKQGRISPRQIHLLREKRRQISPSPSLLSHVQGGLLYLVYGITPQRHQWNLVGADITSTIAYQQRGQVELPKRVSRKVKGLPRIMFHMLVGKQQVQVDRRALNSFRDHESYTIYYAPKSKYALSAEVD